METIDRKTLNQLYRLSLRNDDAEEKCQLATKRLECSELRLYFSKNLLQRRNLNLRFRTLLSTYAGTGDFHFKSAKSENKQNSTKTALFKQRDKIVLKNLICRQKADVAALSFILANDHIPIDLANVLKAKICWMKNNLKSAKNLRFSELDSDMDFDLNLYIKVVYENFQRTAMYIKSLIL